MIVLLWNRWRSDRAARWLALCLAILTLDLLVGSALLAWELAVLREVMGR